MVVNLRAEDGNGADVFRTSDEPFVQSPSSTRLEKRYQILFACGVVNHFLHLQSGKGEARIYIPQAYFSHLFHRRQPAVGGSPEKKRRLVNPVTACVWILAIAPEESGFLGKHLTIGVEGLEVFPIDDGRRQKGSILQRWPRQ